MWVKGCPVEREPFSAAPAPYFSVCSLNFPPCLFVSVISSKLFVAVYEMNKTHTPSPISHSSPNTPLQSVFPFSLFPSFYFSHPHSIIRMSNAFSLL